MFLANKNVVEKHNISQHSFHYFDGEHKLKEYMTNVINNILNGTVDEVILNSNLMLI